MDENRTRKHIADFLNEVREAVDDSIIDALAVFTNGVDFIVLVGETHKEINDGRTGALLQSLENLKIKEADMRVYAESSWSGFDFDHGNTLEYECSPALNPAARVCRSHPGISSIKSIDPRYEALYRIPRMVIRLAKQDGMKESMKELVAIYWDVLRMYYEKVRAAVEMNLERYWYDERIRTRDLGDAYIVAAELDNFNAHIKLMLEILSDEDVHTIAKLFDKADDGSGGDDDVNFYYGVNVGMDVLLLSDIVASGAKVNVAFIGSSHVRSLAESITRNDEHATWRLTHELGLS